MRSRNIKPGFFKNEELAACSLYARLLFIGLWCMADREGRLEKRPLRIKAEVFPYDSLDINGELTVLERNGFIQTYVVEGKEYLQVLNFKEHQAPHHTEAKSKLPKLTAELPLAVNPPLDLREYPPDSLIPDSLIPDSLIPDSEQKAKKMTINDFRFVHQDKFGINMAPGCNQLAHELCQSFTAETIIAAFETAAVQGKQSVAYVKGVLMGNGSKPIFKAETPPQLKTFETQKVENTMKAISGFLERMGVNGDETHDGVLKTDGGNVICIQG